MRTFTPIFVVLISMSTALRADNSQCSDILKEGIFQHAAYRDNSYFQQIIYSRFARSSYAESSSNRAGGFGIPVGEIVLGGNYSESDFRRKQEEVRNTYFNQITAVREIDVALASGDPTIVNAWSECMKTKGGGLSVRFEAVSPSDIFASVAWYPNGPHPTTTLKETVIFPPHVKVVQGGDCFKKGRKIEALNPCRARLTSSDATKLVAVTVNSTEASTEAFLPARYVKVRDVKVHPGSNPQSAYAHGFRSYAEPQGALELNDAEIKAGWRFDAGGTSAKLYVVWTHGGGNSCWDEWQNLQPYRFSFGYKIIGHRGGRNRNRHIYCAMNVSGRLVRDRWVGADRVEVPGDIEGTSVASSKDTDEPLDDAALEQIPKLLVRPEAEWQADDSYGGLEAAVPRQPER